MKREGERECERVSEKERENWRGRTSEERGWETEMRLREVDKRIEKERDERGGKSERNERDNERENGDRAERRGRAIERVSGCEGQEQASRP